MLRIAALSAAVGCALASCESEDTTYTVEALHPNDFTCLGADAASITFANNPNMTVPDLPEIRVLMGGWASQRASHYAAFIFLREKLGVNVTFYPEWDPTASWSAYTDSENSYPDYYYTWIRDDKNDFVFEIWPIMENSAGGASYYTAGTVDNGAFNGAYGEISWYIPRYFVDEWPTSIVVEELNNSATLRDAMIQASLGNYTNGTNWIDLYNSSADCAFDASAFTADGFTNFNLSYMRAQSLDASLYSDITSVMWDGLKATECDFDSTNFTGCSFNFTKLVIDMADTDTTSTVIDDYVYQTVKTSKFDLPDGSKPVIWGSVESYSQSQYSWNLTKNLGLDVHFAVTGGEGSLAVLVEEMYKARQPFIANIYTPDPNFAIFDSVEGDNQNFEKMALARNPSQSDDDECYAAGLCQYPVQPLIKIGNPLLADRFPEVWQFYEAFSLSTSAVGDIMSLYYQLSGYANMSESEKWMNASCEWLKGSTFESASTWNNSDWLIDIERYDCMSGCGVAATEGPLVSSTVGGDCNYYYGTCECHYDELFADTNCSESCPGLVGPTYNGTDYSFEFCSGHGSCSTTNRLCTCDKGYGDSGCSTKYSIWRYNIAVGAVVITFSAMIGIVVSACIAWLRMNAQYKTVKALSIDMTTLMSVGLLMMVMSNIVNVLPVNSGTCISFQWLFGLGGILAILSPLLKAYRVSRVFHGGKMLRAVKITDRMLMVMLLKAAALEVIICTAYTFFHEFYGGTVKYYNDDELRIEDTCNDDALTGYINFGSYVYFFIMLCALTYYSYGTRRALSVFKESTCAYFSSFVSLFCTLIVFLFWMVEKDPTFQRAVQAFAVIIVVSAVIGLFYGTRVYRFFTEPENRNVTDGTGVRTTTSYISDTGKSDPDSPASSAAKV